MRNMTRIGLAVALLLAMALGAVQPNLAGAPRAEANPGTNWNASYFNNATLSGSPVLTRVDNEINFNWADGAPAGVPVGADNFSVRWTKTVNFPSSGSWTFRVGADDGVRMWIDVTPIIDEWHGNPEGYRTYTVTVDALTAGNHDLRVEYFEATGNAGVKVEWFAGGSGGGGGTPAPSGPTGAANWNIEYFNSTDLGGPVIASATANDLNFDWGTGSPDGAINADFFTARFTATVNFPTPGLWRFTVTVDDGVRMWIDVTQILDEWQGSPGGTATYTADVYSLTAGNHDLRVEFLENTGDAKISVRWEKLPDPVAPADAGAGDGGSTGAHAIPPAPTTVYAAVVGDRVNVRSGPGQGNPVITQILYEENYVVLAGTQDLGWLQIELAPGSSGWVSNEWVWLFPEDKDKWQDTTGGGQPDFVDDIPRVDTVVAPPALPPDGPPRVTLTGAATDTVNLRDGASLYGSRVIGSIPQNATFIVEARNDNGAWYLINYQDIRGWVSALYVRLLDGEVRQLVVSAEVVEAPPFGEVFVPVDEQGEPVTVRGQANANLKLREGATLNSDQVGSVPQFAEFVIEARTSGGSWYRITFEGQPGWVNAAYVTLIEGTVPDIPVQ